MIKEQMIHSNSSAPILPMQCYKQPFVELYNEDCLETLKRIETGSVDLMLQDTPYGTTKLDWDYEPNLSEMWMEWERVLKPNGIWVFTCQQPFTSKLVLSRLGFFKYEIIWEKTIPTGMAQSSYMPMRYHENILVFYRQKGTYNPQREKRSQVGIQRLKGNGRIKNSNGTSKHIDIKKPEYSFYEVENVNPKSIQKFGSEPNCNGTKLHPTQKPIDLFRYLIKTYSNENDIVFDGYSGSGTTAAACLKEKRRFIGSELNKEYFDLSVKRLDEIVKQPELF